MFKQQALQKKKNVCVYIYSLLYLLLIKRMCSTQITNSNKICKTLFFPQISHSQFILVEALVDFCQTLKFIINLWLQLMNIILTSTLVNIFIYFNKQDEGKNTKEIIWNFTHYQ